MKTLDIWGRLSTKPGGKWLFSRLVCFKAPYFGSIRPRIVELKPGYTKVCMRKRRAVQNHIGTVHAIAMCNLAELAGGTMTEVTVPSSHRWIPKGMEVSYLNKATTDLVAVATPETEPGLSVPSEYKVNVDVRDAQDVAVFHAEITMWITPKKK